MPDNQITLTMDPELLRLCKELAEAENRSVSNWMETTLRRVLISLKKIKE